VVFRKPVERLQHFEPLHQPVIYLRNRRGRPGFPEVPQMRVDQNAEEPGADVTAGFEAAEGAPCLQVCLLDEIFRRGQTARQPACESQQIPQMRQRGPLELVLSLRHCLRLFQFGQRGEHFLTVGVGLHLRINFADHAVGVD